MQPLKDALAQLRRDLADALAADLAAPAPWRLEPDRAVVELAVVLDAGAWRVFDATDPLAKAGPAHRVTVEFSIGGRGGPDRGSVEPPRDPSVAPHPPTPLPAGEPDSLVGRLSQVFGAPGFDSSARATVFREALEGFSVADIRSAIASAGLASADEANGDVRRAAHLVGRLIQRGPAGMDRSREILADVFRQIDSAEVLALVERVWKTQDDWIDRSAES
jgi:hypothetical protein